MQILSAPCPHGQCPDLYPEPQEIENACNGESCREPEPYAGRAEVCLESQEIRRGNRDDVVAYECHQHNGLYVLYPAQGIAETELEPVAELV